MIRRLIGSQKGSATVEMAFALPALVVMLWMIVQLGLVFRAMSGIQHALGQGARYATLCIPSATGCSRPTNAQIKTQIESAVYGIGPGTFTYGTPVAGTQGGANYLDLTVSYTQNTNLIFVPGPSITVSRSKRVWVAGT
jgi:Flp pilus assembly protein TadG